MWRKTNTHANYDVINKRGNSLTGLPPILAQKLQPFLSTFVCIFLIYLSYILINERTEYKWVQYYYVWCKIIWINKLKRGFWSASDEFSSTSAPERPLVSIIGNIAKQDLFSRKKNSTTTTSVWMPKVKLFGGPLYISRSLLHFLLTIFLWCHEISYVE